ncbi:MAG: FAD/NAD(P)-binding protein, partial [Candidatus Sericytochromatia bacterium]
VPGVLDSVDPDEDVLLIGAGLTAIDWALSLATRGHRGHIHLLSRQGRLPHVHVPGLSPRPAVLPAPPYTATGLLAWVREQVRAAEAAGLDWRQTVDGLRPHLQGLWRGLSHGERRRFLRHARPYWEVHRHRMAPEVAGAIGRLRESGQLTLHAGRVEAYEEGPTGVSVRVRLRGGGHAIVSVARVVNCTGPEADFRKKRHPLVANLLERGLVRPDALGMGIEVGDDGAVLDAQGAPSTNLFALGPVRKGGLWETTAVPELRAQASALAKALI